jgi:hypothetical protein
MLFNSYAFLLVFLPAALLVCCLADRFERWRIPVVIVLSLSFYSYWDIRFLVLMVASILFNWWAAKIFAATRRQAVIAIAIIGNLAVLGIFKYAGFLTDNLAVLFGLTPPQFQIVLPLGISFFTFHHVMYLVDLGRGRAPIFPLDRYALYISFFPQAIAGPIARWNEIIDQFGRRILSPGWERRWAIGVTFIVLGLAQKVLLADTIGAGVDPIYNQALVGPVERGQAWIGLAFALQVFFEFAGYSDIAIGLGLLFNVEIPRNFDAPFQATSIREFWRRWHMTLSRFLRDYLYVPFGGNRHGLPRQLVALLATMALGGLWHGAGWTFVVWGVAHGVALCANTLWQRYLPPLPRLVGWATTFAFVTLAFVVFRAGSLQAAWRIYEGLLYAPPVKFDGRNSMLLALVIALLLPASHVICRWLTAKPKLPIAVGLAALATVILISLRDDANIRFVYFQF